MKILLFLSMALAVSAVGSDLRVVTFNTGLVCVGPYCILADSERVEERAQQTGKWLKEINADIIFLQEVWQKWQYDIFLRKSGMPYGTYPDKMGQAILSKYPLTHVKFTPFRWQGALKTDYKRLTARYLVGMTAATATTPQGDLDLFIVHALPRWPDLEGFDKPSDVRTPERYVTILEMREVLKARMRPKIPFIFAGDFNMNKLSDEYPFFLRIHPLQDALRTAAENRKENWKSLCTFCADNPWVKAQASPGELVLDYLFLPPGAFQVKDAVVLSATDLFSDHRAVLATLTRQPGFPPVALGSAQTEEIVAIERHLEKVEIHPFCWLAPLSWQQRSRALKFLQDLHT